MNLPFCALTFGLDTHCKRVYFPCPNTKPFQAYLKFSSTPRLYISHSKSSSVVCSVSCSLFVYVLGRVFTMSCGWEFWQHVWSLPLPEHHPLFTAVPSGMTKQQKTSITQWEVNLGSLKVGCLTSETHGSLFHKPQDNYQSFFYPSITLFSVFLNDLPTCKIPRLQGLYLYVVLRRDSPARRVFFISFWLCGMAVYSGRRSWIFSVTSPWCQAAVSVPVTSTATREIQ